MKSFSIYHYNNIELQDIKQTINDVENWHDPVTDPITSRELEFRFEKVRELSIDLKSKQVNCLYVSFKNEKLSYKHRENTDENKRIRKNDSDFIIFNERDSVIVIPLKGKNPTTGSLLRTALNINEEGRLIDYPFELKEDYFYWIFNRYLNLKNITEQDNDNLTINSLTGFTGETRDTVNKIDGKGNRISKILWTLAFLFTNESLKSITPEITHNRIVDDEEIREKIKLELTLNGTYKIDESEHIGTQFFNNDKDYKTSYLLIYTYKILIPELKEHYDKDIREQIWSPHIKKQFITSIGSEIQSQVEETLQTVNEELNK